MRPRRKLRERSDEPGDLGAGLGMAKDRQRERRFRNEDVAGNRYEGQACRVGAALVVARGDDAEPPRLDGDLGRAEDMAGRMKGDGDLADPHGLAELRGLRSCRKPLRVAHGHDLQRLGGCEDCVVPGAGMVGMAVGDQRPLDRPNRVDVESAELRMKPIGRRAQEVFRTHGLDIDAAEQTAKHWRFGYPIAVATFRFVVAFVFLAETRPFPSSPMAWRSPRWGSGAPSYQLCGGEAAAPSSRWAVGWAKAVKPCPRGRV